MMGIEDQIAKIILDEYASYGYLDEGHSTAAAHDIMAIVNVEIERLETLLAEVQDLLSDGPGGPRRLTAIKLIEAAIAGKKRTSGEMADEIERLQDKVRNRDELIMMHRGYEEGLKAVLKRLRAENAALAGK